LLLLLFFPLFLLLWYFLPPFLGLKGAPVPLTLAGEDDVTAAAWAVVVVVVAAAVVAALGAGGRLEM
jgi:hypothetical protein